MKSKYQMYPSYKESGVEWLGEIPSHYEYIRLKFLGHTFGGLSGKAGKDFNQEEHEDNKIFIPFTNIANNHYIKDDNFGTVTVSPDESQNKVKKNDLFFLMSSEGYEDLGKSSLLGFELDEAYLNSFCKGFRITSKNIDPKYLNYLLSGDTYRQLLYTQGNGFTRINLRLEKLNDLQLLIASTLHEQQTIANYLDKATAKIDTLIKKQTRLIELLKEKRQAVISTAVTRGLDSTVAMKDSGVDWLGEVPEGWMLSKFAYLSIVVRGGSPRPAGDPTLFNGDYSPWVTVAEITKDIKAYITETETFLTKKGSEQCRVFSKGTLVLSNSGATLGVPKILSINANANDGVVGFENLSPNVLIMYAYYYLFSLTENLRDRMNQGSGQPNLNTDIVKALQIPLPSIEEQDKLVKFIDNKTSKIDILTTKAEEAIDLLKEKRTALISAVVTGKIDVRETA